MVDLHIGFDDTDSLEGGCTTYIAALLVEKLLKLGATFIDYPNLIRLNPNVPWKTRGNGALCLRISCSEDIVDTVFETVADTVEENSDLGYEDTDPGIVFFQSAEIPQKIRAFTKKTIQGIVTLEEALKLIRNFRAQALGFGTSLGIVGALAAVGETLDREHTFEIIAYRIRENRGTPRQLDQGSVLEMDKKTTSQTFSNVDPETQRILITPRGSDPILYGIRGETPEAVVQAHRIIRSLEPIERWVVFRTNHGTDAHLKSAGAIRDVQPFHPVIITGAVVSVPKIIPRRHVVFSIRDETGTIDCAAYEPTGVLRKIARELIPGDLVEAYGGVRPGTDKYPLTVNLEKLRILKLAPKLTTNNPKCLKCDSRMSSMGAGQGFRCPKCGFKSSDLEKTVVEMERGINEEIYITSPRSQRHLTKPLIRYGREKKNKPKKMIIRWHSY